jgi:hypothetical protein
LLLADFNAIETQYGKGTNWLNEVFRKAAMQNVTLTATGGSDKAQYSFSAAISNKMVFCIKQIMNGLTYASMAM